MRLVVADDSMLFREGVVRLLIEAGHEVMAAVGDGDALRLAVADHTPDVAIIDIRMPPDKESVAAESVGAIAAVELRRTHPHTAIMLLSQHIELRHCLDLIGTPGFGYLLKDRVVRLDDFDDSLRRVASSGSALDPQIARALVQARRLAIDVLTEREVEVLSLVAEGHANVEIARRLALSDRTVEAHMRSVFSKLDLYDDGTTHRRVLAVITYLEAQNT